MKLHLPHGLRKALLACLAAIALPATLPSTLGTASGVAAVWIVASHAVRAAETPPAPELTGEEDDDDLMLIADGAVTWTASGVDAALTWDTTSTGWTTGSPFANGESVTFLGAGETINATITVGAAVTAGSLTIGDATAGDGATFTLTAGQNAATNTVTVTGAVTLNGGSGSNASDPLDRGYVLKLENVNFTAQGGIGSSQTGYGKQGMLIVGSGATVNVSGSIATVNNAAVSLVVNHLKVSGGTLNVTENATWVNTGWGNHSGTNVLTEVTDGGALTTKYFATPHSVSVTGANSRMTVEGNAVLNNFGRLTVKEGGAVTITGNLSGNKSSCAGVVTVGSHDDAGSTGGTLTLGTDDATGSYATHAVKVYGTGSTLTVYGNLTALGSEKESDSDSAHETNIGLEVKYGAGASVSGNLTLGSSDDNLEIGGTEDGNTGTLTVGGTLAGASVSVQGKGSTLTVDGTVTLTGSLVINNGTVTLSGGGTIGTVQLGGETGVNGGSFTISTGLSWAAGSSLTLGGSLQAITLGGAGWTDKLATALSGAGSQKLTVTLGANFLNGVEGNSFTLFTGEGVADFTQYFDVNVDALSATYEGLVFNENGTLTWGGGGGDNPPPSADGLVWNTANDDNMWGEGHNNWGEGNQAWVAGSNAVFNDDTGEVVTLSGAVTAGSVSVVKGTWTFAGDGSLSASGLTLQGEGTTVKFTGAGAKNFGGSADSPGIHLGAGTELVIAAGGEASGNWAKDGVNYAEGEGSIVLEGVNVENAKGGAGLLFAFFDSKTGDSNTGKSIGALRLRSSATLTMSGEMAGDNIQNSGHSLGYFKEIFVEAGSTLNITSGALGYKKHTGNKLHLAGTGAENAGALVINYDASDSGKGSDQQINWDIVADADTLISVMQGKTFNGALDAQGNTLTIKTTEGQTTTLKGVFTAGDKDGTKGTLELSGGTVELGEGFSMAGSEGTLRVSGGTVSSEQAVTLGNVALDDGTLTLTAGGTASALSGTGTLNVGGGTLTVGTAEGATLSNLALTGSLTVNAGSFTISGGWTWAEGGSLTLGAKGQVITLSGIADLNGETAAEGHQLTINITESFLADGDGTDGVQLFAQEGFTEALAAYFHVVVTDDEDNTYEGLTLTAEGRLTWGPTEPPPPPMDLTWNKGDENNVWDAAGQNTNWTDGATWNNRGTYTAVFADAEGEGVTLSGKVQAAGVKVTQGTGWQFTAADSGGSLTIIGSLTVADGSKLAVGGGTSVSVGGDVDLGTSGELSLASDLVFGGTLTAGDGKVTRSAESGIFYMLWNGGETGTMTGTEFHDLFGAKLAAGVGYGVSAGGSGVTLSGDFTIGKNFKVSGSGTTTFSGNVTMGNAVGITIDEGATLAVTGNLVKAAGGSNEGKVSVSGSGTLELTLGDGEDGHFDGLSTTQSVSVKAHLASNWGFLTNVNILGELQVDADKEIIFDGTNTVGRITSSAEGGQVHKLSLNQGNHVSTTIVEALTVETLSMRSGKLILEADLTVNGAICNDSKGTTNGGIIQGTNVTVNLGEDGQISEDAADGATAAWLGGLKLSGNFTKTGDGLLVIGGGSGNAYNAETDPGNNVLSIDGAVNINGGRVVFGQNAQNDMSVGNGINLSGSGSVFEWRGRTLTVSGGTVSATGGASLAIKYLELKPGESRLNFAAGAVTSGLTLTLTGFELGVFQAEGGYQLFDAECWQAAEWKDRITLDYGELNTQGGSIGFNETGALVWSAAAQPSDGDLYWPGNGTGDTDLTLGGNGVNEWSGASGGELNQAWAENKNVHLEATAGTITVTVAQNVSMAGLTLADGTAEYTFGATEARTVTVAGALSNGATLTVGNNVTLALSGSYTGNGTLKLAGGTLTLAAGGTVSTLSGTGTLNVSGGALTVGTAEGATLTNLALTGSLTVSAGSFTISGGWTWGDGSSLTLGAKGQVITLSGMTDLNGATSAAGHQLTINISSSFLEGVDGTTGVQLFASDGFSEALAAYFNVVVTDGGDAYTGLTLNANGTLTWGGALPEGLVWDTANTDNTWGDGHDNWKDGDQAGQAWTPNSDAVFSDDTGETVTLSGAVEAGNVSVVKGTWTFTGSGSLSASGLTLRGTGTTVKFTGAGAKGFGGSANSPGIHLGAGTELVIAAGGEGVGNDHWKTGGANYAEGEGSIVLEGVNVTNAGNNAGLLFAFFAAGDSNTEKSIGALRLRSSDDGTASTLVMSGEMGGENTGHSLGYFKEIYVEAGSTLKDTSGALGKKSHTGNVLHLAGTGAEGAGALVISHERTETWRQVDWDIVADADALISVEKSKTFNGALGAQGNTLTLKTADGQTTTLKGTFTAGDKDGTKGTLELSGGTVVLGEGFSMVGSEGTLKVSGGTVNSGQEVTLGNVVMESGTLTLTAGGTASALSGTGGTLNVNGGTLTVGNANGATLTNLALTGSLTVNGGSFGISEGWTWGNGSGLMLGGSLQKIALNGAGWADKLAANGSKLSITLGANFLTGASGNSFALFTGEGVTDFTQYFNVDLSALSSYEGLTFNADGTLSWSGGGSVEPPPSEGDLYWPGNNAGDTDLTLGGNGVNEWSGTSGGELDQAWAENKNVHLEATAGTITVTVAQNVSMAGLTLADGTAEYTFGATEARTVTVAGELSNGATLTVGSNVTLALSGSYTGNGTLKLAGGAVQSSRSVSMGKVVMESGTLTLTAGGTVGTLSGTGTLNVNGGTLTVGTVETAGRLAVNGGGFSVSTGLSWAAGSSLTLGGTLQAITLSGEGWTDRLTSALTAAGGTKLAVTLGANFLSGAEGESFALFTGGGVADYTQYFDVDLSALSTAYEGLVFNADGTLSWGGETSGGEVYWGSGDGSELTWGAEGGADFNTKPDGSGGGVGWTEGANVHFVGKNSAERTVKLAGDIHTGSFKATAEEGQTKFSFKSDGGNARKLTVGGNMAVTRAELAFGSDVGLTVSGNLSLTDGTLSLAGETAVRGKVSGTGRLAAAEKGRVTLAGDVSEFAGTLDTGTDGTISLSTSEGEGFKGKVIGTGTLATADKGQVTLAGDVSGFGGTLDVGIGGTLTLRGTAVGDEVNVAAGGSGTLAVEVGEGGTSSYTGKVSGTGLTLKNAGSGEMVVTSQAEGNGSGTKLDGGTGGITLGGTDKSAVWNGKDVTGGAITLSNVTLAGGGLANKASGAKIYVDTAPVAGVNTVARAATPQGGIVDVAGMAAEKLDGITVNAHGQLTNVTGTYTVGADKKLALHITEENVSRAADDADSRVLISGQDFTLDASSKGDVTLELADVAASVLDMLSGQSGGEAYVHVLRGGTLSMGELTLSDFKGLEIFESVVEDFAATVDGGNVRLTGTVKDVYVVDGGEKVDAAVLERMKAIVFGQGKKATFTAESGAVLHNLLGASGSVMQLEKGNGASGDVTFTLDNTWAGDIAQAETYPKVDGSSVRGQDTVFAGSIVGGRGVDIVKSGMGTLTVGGEYSLADGDTRLEAGALCLRGTGNHTNNLVFAYGSVPGAEEERGLLLAEGSSTRIGSLSEAAGAVSAEGNKVQLTGNAELTLTGASALASTAITGDGQGVLHLAEGASLRFTGSQGISGAAVDMKNAALDLGNSKSTLTELNGTGTLKSAAGTEVTVGGGVFSGVLGGTVSGADAGTLVVEGGKSFTLDKVKSEGNAKMGVRLGQGSGLTVKVGEKQGDGSDMLRFGNIELGGGQLTVDFGGKAFGDKYVTGNVVSVGEGGALEFVSNGSVKGDTVYTGFTVAEGLRGQVGEFVQFSGIDNLLYDHTVGVTAEGQVVLELRKVGANRLAELIPGAHKNGLAGATMMWGSLQVRSSSIDWLPDIISNPGSAYAQLAFYLAQCNEGSVSPAGLDRTLAAVAGTAISTLGTALGQDIHRQLNTIRNRTTGMGGTEHAAGEKQQWHAWIQGEGNYHKLDADGLAPGYTLNSWGGTVGVDTDVSRRVTVGLAVTAMYGDLDPDSAESATGDLDTAYLSAFARVSHGAWKHTFAVSGGFADVKLDRTVNYNGTSYRTSGSTDGYALGVLYEVGYTRLMNAAGTIALQPVFNVEWRHASLDGYTESGSDAGVNTDDITQDVVTFGAGARAQFAVAANAFNHDAVLETRALVKADVGDRSGTADNAMVGDAARAEVESAEVGAVGVELGVGLSVPIGDNMGSVFADGSLEFRSGWTSANATVGYRMNF